MPFWRAPLLHAAARCPPPVGALTYGARFAWPVTAVAHCVLAVGVPAEQIDLADRSPVVHAAVSHDDEVAAEVASAPVPLPRGRAAAPHRSRQPVRERGLSAGVRCGQHAWSRQQRNQPAHRIGASSLVRFRSRELPGILASRQALVRSTMRLTKGRSILRIRRTRSTKGHSCSRQLLE